jgi:tetratricopeptide (TPR) repeat protein
MILNRQTFTINDLYEKLFQSYPVKSCYPREILNFQSPQIMSQQDNLSSVCDFTLAVISKCTHGTLALDLLNLMSFMNKDGIYALLFHHLPELKNPLDVNNAMILLNNFSLISIHGSEIKISRFIQNIIQNKCKNKQELLQSLLQCFYKSIGTNQYYPNKCMSIEFEFRSHVMTIYDDYLETNKKVMEKFAILFLLSTVIGTQKNQIQLLMKISYAINCRFEIIDVNVQKVIVDLFHRNKLYDKVIEICDKISNTITPEIFNSNYYCLRILHHKADSLFNLKQIDEAWIICEKSYRLQIDNFEANMDSFDTLKLLCTISIALLESGKSEQFKTCIELAELAYLEQFDWVTEEYMSDILDALDIIINHKLKTINPVETLKYIKDIKSKLEIKFKNSPVDDFTDESPGIRVLLNYKIALCLFQMKKEKKAWNIITKMIYNSYLQYSTLSHEGLILTYCKITAKLNDIKSFQKCISILKVYMYDDMYYIDSGYEHINCIQMLESTSVCLQLNTIIIRLYSDLVKHFINKNELKSAVKVQLCKAMYLCKYINMDSAWDVYENLCNIYKYQMQAKPQNVTSMLEIFVQLQSEIK